MFEMRAAVLVSLLLALLPAISGLKCYACVQSGSEDRRCETDPKSIQNSAINCNKKYCVIRRIEYIDQPGKVFSFYRGCEQRPDYINAEISDSQFKTFYRSCTTDLCNSGSGTSNSGGGGGGGISSGGDGDNGAILVPGTSSAPQSLATTLATTLAILAALLAVLF